MNLSRQIRDLLTRFPALKPKAVERLLAARGIVVDANLIGVARLRHRRKEQADRIIIRLLEKLLTNHSGLFPVVQASFMVVLRRLVDVAAAHPTCTDDQIADELAKELSNMPVEETLIARWSRIFKRLLEQHPQYKRSMELVLGLRGDFHSIISVPIGDGLDDLTDEQLEHAILAHLVEHFPAGPTVEDIARSYFDSVQEREKRADDERRKMAETEQDRAAKVLAVVLDALHSPAADHDAALVVVQNFVAQFADWPDEDIAARVVAGMDLALNHEEKVPHKKVPLHTDGLTIRSRP
jgi:hypothetical protein